MYVIYDYWMDWWTHTYVWEEITYPAYPLFCNESVWIVPGTITE